MDVGLENENRPSMIPEFSPPATCSTCSENLNPLPKVWISASAIGYYKNSSHPALEETSPPGNGFLANICKDWEAEIFKANALRI
jgi:NAD dependent epimerase/dehydratase family enzyme